MFDRARTVAQVIFLSAIVIWVGIGSWYSSQESHSNKISRGSDQHAQNEFHNEQDGIWGHSDPGVTFVTALLVIVGAAQLGLFLVQLRFIRESLDDAKVAVDAAKDGAAAAIEANRPWVHIKSVKFTQPLKFIPRGAISTVEITTENVGRSPAVGVTVWAKFIPVFLGGQDTEETQKELLNEAIKGANVFTPSAIFPNQTTLRSISVSILRTEWEPAIWKKEGEIDRAFLSLGVCTCYRFSLAGDIKHSSRIFRVGWIPVSGEEVSLDQLNMGLDASNWDGAS